MSERKFVWVDRFKKVGDTIVNFGRVEIPAEHLDMTLKAQPLFVVVTEDEPTAPQIEPPVVPTTTQSGNVVCPICGLEFKTDKALALHRKRKHA